MNEEKTNPVEGQNETQEMDELTAAQDRIKELEKQIEYQRDSNCKEYRKVEILKGALKILKEKYSISDGDYFAALVADSNGKLDIDNLLYQLSK
ncbi:MAG: hypothetical protein IKZ92_05660 [Muribaculaceae bacterium]|nr:hypothetical protein [Muribaculaceae bacterium]